MSNHGHAVYGQAVSMSVNTQNGQYSYGAEDPEDFYRPASTVAETHNSSTTSPANSDAPIMRWQASSQPEYPFPSGTTDPSHHPPPHTPQYSQPAFVPPPAIPEVNNYRSSMGVVNGEVGGGAYVDPYSVPAHTPTAAPLTPGLKTPATAVFRAADDLNDFTVVDEKVFKDSQKDLAVKLKIRLAKVVLRSVNCACSLVVLSLLGSTFAIFNATKNLPLRNGLPPWSRKTPLWPQITVLCISSLSLALSLTIMFTYWKGSKKRAAKAAFWATILAAGGFIFSTVIWGFSIGIMQGSRATQEAQDLWGWSCKDNQRRQLFQDTINYKLVCRQNDWVVVCAIIEIVVETISIGVYVFAFYRFHTKRQLRKSMAVRDEQRSSLWLAKLKEQQAAEADAEDQETSMNTQYNQMNTNSSEHYISAEEARAVPMLQAPPPGHRNSGQAPNGQLIQGAAEVPPPPPPAMFRRDSLVPGTPRSVSFQPAARVVE